MSSPLTWLVFGSKGWIGEQVVSLLLERCDKYGDNVYLTDVRADNEQEVYNLLADIKPNRVVSLIGRTHGEGFNTIDYLEQPGKLVENVRDNLYGPFVIASTCDKLGIHYTYLGTGCTFSSDDINNIGNENDKGFSEKSDPNFFGSSYSIVKGFTDRMMKQFEDNVLNVRIRMPIIEKHHPRNFITKITKYDRVCSISNSMTVLPELLPIMIDMAVQKKTGTINLTNPGVISHNEILAMYKEIVDPNFTWKNFSIEEQNQILLSKRSNNKLNTELLQQLYPNVRHIKDAVRDMLYKMKSFTRSIGSL